MVIAARTRTALSNFLRDLDRWRGQADQMNHARLMEAVLSIHGIWNTRVSTAQLNRWFEATVAAHPPPAVSGRRLKLNYITQPKTRPPSFVLFCSRADAVPTSYLRYLVNSLREAFDLPGTPIRITLREKANPFAHKRKRPS